jgi:hypothetical protein
LFAYGVCVGRAAKYRAYAKPSLRKFAAGSPVLVRRQQSSIFEAYNSILDEAREIPDLEGVVLLHEDVELRGRVDLVLRRELADETVAVVGAIGGRGVNSVRWAKSDQTFGYAPDAYWGDNDHGRGHHDVDIVDGLLLCLSPWAAVNLRFDEATFRGFHGYDADICMQARAAGRRVRVAELPLFHHTKGGFGDVAEHRRVDDRFRKKWTIPREPLRYRLRQRIKKLPY